VVLFKKHGFRAKPSDKKLGFNNDKNLYFSCFYTVIVEQVALTWISSWEGVGS